MRDILVLLILAPAVPYALVAPQVGLLLWCWTAFMAPQRLVYGIVQGANLNMVIAGATIAGWLFSKEKKRIPSNAAAILIYLLMLWITISSWTSIGDYFRTWDLWDRSIKTLILAIMIMMICDRKVRIHSVIWVAVLSLAFYGVKGGAFVLKSGGSTNVFGPESTMIGDNNHLAVALDMTIPLMFYLLQQSERKVVRLILIASIILTIFGVIGTYSRGGFIGLCIVLAYFWWRSKIKIWLAVAAILVLVPAIKFMPEKWIGRIDTIERADQDTSVQGRLDAWQFATNVALDRPLVGGGFGVFYTPGLWPKYAPGKEWRAPHSIYFEVLGSHGFVGLAIFLGLATVAWRNAAWIMRRTKGIVDLFWARDLAIMIQVSLAGYFVAGASVTLAFYDVYYAEVAILAVLRACVARYLEAEAPAAAKGDRVTKRLRAQPTPVRWAGAPQSSRGVFVSKQNPPRVTS